MKKMYTFAGYPAERNWTVADLIANKGKRKFSQTTAVSLEEAQAVAAVGIDMLNINDTDVGLIRQGAPHTFITAALPLTNYITVDEALRAAFAAMEAGADAIYSCMRLEIITALAKANIPVMGHEGLVPRLSGWIGGVRAFGKRSDEAISLYQRLKQLEEAGAFAVELELVPNRLMAELTKRTSLVTVSMGSGTEADVVTLFMEDLCGENLNPPRHAKAYRDLGRLHAQIHRERIEALAEFDKDVSPNVGANGRFPTPAQSVRMPQNELDAFLEEIEGG